MGNPSSISKVFSYLIFACLLSFQGQAQVVAFQDSFDLGAGSGNWSLNATHVINGRACTVNGENQWVVNNDYAGVTVPVVIRNTDQQPAGITQSPNSQYLHILSTVASGAGVNNANYSFTTPGPNEQYMAHMNVGAVTTGLNNVTVSFWWLNWANQDTSGQVVYSTDGGNTWNKVAKYYVADTVWKQEFITLPAFDNQADLRIGFVFVNPDAGTSPGFAIDDVMITGSAAGTPIAQFTSNKQIVCLGQTCVQFTDLSTGGPSRWKWDFGTGVAADTSNAQNPQFCFPSVVGKYTVSLNVWNGNGIGTPEVKPNYIEVVDCNQPPKANFKMNGMLNNTITICAGDSVIFQDTSSGQVNSYYWSFPGARDDSGFCRIANDTNPNAVIYYPCSGSFGRDTVYTVTLSASGNGGADFITKSVRVRACIAPIAKITADIQSKTCEGQCLSFVYDRSVEDEFYISSKPNLTWYFWGIDTNALDSGYTYSPDGPTNHPTKTDTVFTGDTNTVCYADSGTYQVVLVAENIYGKDSAVFPYQVSVYPNPNVIATVEDSILLRGYSTTLSTLEQYSLKYCRDLTEFDLFNGDSCCCFNYYWYYRDSVDNDIVFDNITNPNSRATPVRPEVDTRYYVLKENYNGCQVLDSVDIVIGRDYYAGAPDVFTPGTGASQNSKFYVFGNQITKINAKVYNRYGQIVYETDVVSEIVWESDINPVGAGWDGTYRNQREKELDPGVYTYFVKVWHENGDYKELKGNVTLVR